MSNLFTPRNAAIAMGGVGAVLFFMPKSSKPVETFGSQNIADRMSAGGGSNTHTPGAATPLGKPEQTRSPQENPKGIDTDHFKNRQADQKANDKSAPEKALNKAAYGQEQGK